MKYLFKNDMSFGFKDPEINTIVETDVLISNEIYNKFFELQAQGKQFKIRNINGTTFDEIFEEIIPEPVEPLPQEPSPIEKMQEENAELKKQVQETQQSMAEIMNLIAMQQTP